MAHVVITGGSRGIGAEAVREFRRRGDRVTFLYARSGEAAEALARETGAEAVRCDVTDPEAVGETFRHIGDTDVLICNAGVAHQGLVTDIGEAEWHRLFEVNVHGMYRCICAALPAMIRRQAGSIITVASMWGQVGGSCEAGYSASKAAVIGLTKALAKELAPSGIRVNCIAPGVIRTRMLDGFTEAELEELRLETPLEQLGTPEDVGHLAAFLASDRAKFITGQVVGLNGGFVI